MGRCGGMCGVGIRVGWMGVVVMILKCFGLEFLIWGSS